MSRAIVKAYIRLSTAFANFCLTWESRAFKICSVGDIRCIILTIDRYRF